ncbi:ABC transporter permease [Spirochaeta thermophila]|uniref:Oligopeptide ABC transporter, permease protein n=1 Tax=Winmispira thermophila (strain ATCC 49972 / DSM 6192 / RI 19.B1) TaxID=665571 RepID=E0RNX7_WINT6|nr:ABC transporter permease subunit [Spirochaeta thermophila]ADN01250.1 oligopeptide ABC transporter, permease protein [Spirochaeta thermophila DSM 6192]
MGKYIVRRFLGLIPTLFIIVTLSFFIIRFAPGGPFDAEKALPKQILENIEKKYHMDETILMQYLRYMGDLVLRGDLGPSFKYQDHDVNYYIFTSLPNSLILGAVSLLIAVVLGMGTGAVSALYRNTWVDYTSMSIAIIGISVPLFVTGPVLMYFLAIKWKVLPTSGWITGREGLKTLIMPALTLAFPYYANIARLFRASVLEVLQSDYIRTARAKGLSTPVILFRHVFKGASIPVVSYLGPAFAGIVTGSVVVETIFRIPGLGRYFVQSAFNRDYTLILGTVIVYSVILVLMNFVVDIIYGLLDPRISYRE